MTSSKLAEKLKENKRYLLIKEVKERLNNCTKKGFIYQFTEAELSRKLLDTVLSNSIVGIVREVGVISKKEAKQLLKETIITVGSERINDIVYLFHPQSDEVGAIKSTLKDCIEHLDCLLDFIEFEDQLLSNSFILMEPSFTFVICLFHTEYGCELFYAKNL
ncbi:reverse transcriptase [Bacillus stercoris]|uniref:Reverse transcriptase n=1 Tax=Bacillus cabrialesii subsp. tritici TaxID=2944916 RepID=A0ABT9DRG8_9BACI|nr:MULTISPECIES: reverse transcriptase [Bacillus]TXF69558.1 reverse transcriptase [Bacillus subtilis]MDN0191732.1 reverse transcriptase [Bacillus sp. B.PNR1]MDN3032638.1 reverse transcriptase [Bacillus sp. B.PNR2]MDO8227305.1 reverse transcriptase [Bacillus cabrialesii subsp. tritici]QRZ92796.1 reverse transcriptase [Bacillus sp. LJBS06]